MKRNLWEEVMTAIPITARIHRMVGVLDAIPFFSCSLFIYVETNELLISGRLCQFVCIQNMHGFLRETRHLFWLGGIYPSLGMHDTECYLSFRAISSCKYIMMIQTPACFWSSSSLYIRRKLTYYLNEKKKKKLMKVKKRKKWAWWHLMC